MLRSMLSSNSRKENFSTKIKIETYWFIWETFPINCPSSDLGERRSIIMGLTSQPRTFLLIPTGSKLIERPSLPQGRAWDVHRSSHRSFAGGLRSQQLFGWITEASGQQRDHIVTASLPTVALAREFKGGFY